MGKQKVEKIEPKEEKKPERQILFGSWTGKTPVSMLYELCQKEGWGKPSFNNRRTGKGNRCTIGITQRNKKTGQTDQVTWCPPMDFESEQLAKHACATFVLHRLRSHLAMHKLMPPSMRTLWEQWDAEKAKLPESETRFDFAPDPFAALEARKNAIEFDRINERKAREREQEEEKLKASPWLEYPEIYIPKEARADLENLIRSNFSVLHQNTPTGNVKHIYKKLIAKGFKKVHVDEALSHCSTFESCLDWLNLYVPEEDLPPSMVAENKKIELLTHDQASLSKEYLLKRLISNGFSREHCQQYMDDNELAALTKLCWDLAAYTPVDPIETVDQELLQEEISVLESIFGDQYQVVTSDHGISLSFHLEGTSLEVHIENSLGYPQHLPAVLIKNDNIAKYIKQAIIKRVLQECQHFLGSPMIFSVVSWLQENMQDMIDNPQSLLSLAQPTDLSLDNLSFASVEPMKAKKKSGTKQLKPNQERLLAKIQSQDYQKMLESRKKLPSYGFKPNIVQALQSNQVLLISGETGCGKSTQVGQFLLEDAIETGTVDSCYIICTQPRRISAMSLAQRVSAERCERVGESIGYAVRGDSKSSADTRLLFCTTGILLRMIQSDPDLQQVSHVVIDEVHEREINSDFLIILLKELLLRRNDVRLVLMSATVDAHLFTTYFRCPVLKIPGFTYPVQDYYLEDILKVVDYSPSSRKLDKNQDIHEEEGIDTQTFQKLRALEQSVGSTVEYPLIAKVTRYILETSDEGAILIFMSGVAEIKSTIDHIQREIAATGFKTEIFPLHSQLTPSDQQKVFRTMKPGTRKIIVSTNIGETSITINDVVYVIDTGRVKEMQLVGNVLTLAETFASKAACKQRRGRAGRVQAGQCFKLFSRKFEEKKMLSSSPPEMLRMPLENVCLQIRSISKTKIVHFLGQALSPPPESSVLEAVGLLKRLKAMDDEEILTPLGRHLAELPVDLQVGKLLIYGAIFKCIEPVLTVAAYLGGKTPFITIMDQMDECKRAHQQFKVPGSDFLSVCKAYQAWESTRQKEKFCRENCLSNTSLTAMKQLRDQLRSAMEQAGYISKSDDSANAHSDSEQLMLAILTAGFYPNIARVKVPPQAYEQTTSGAIAVLPDASDIKFYTKENGRVFMHPSSFLFGSQKYPHSYLVYGSKVQTKKLYLRDCSSAPAISMLLFGGDFVTMHDGNSLVLDSTFRFRAFPKITMLISGIRKILDLLLDEKLKNPKADVMDSPIGNILICILKEQQSTKS
ncbi:P-loop containing nucleoside triphosphate hydrolase protein [Gorgonomyces haynaldii]|nr:P-loop containing nucleoside triphosphate hydrolase protein [Gorgonomyces haynaldii]